MQAYQKEEIINHKLWITGRETGIVTGVKDVVSFDLDEIVLDTQLGILTIKGSGLRVKNVNLEKGQVDMEGHIDNMVYTDSKTMKRQSVMGRLFK
ncbi:MAG: sporulation protein YabP [Lachnospiraceae bacterium]|nr:sporulation protein YabP [Lachnospiraceae bacterium]